MQEVFYHLICGHQGKRGFLILCVKGENINIGDINIFNVDELLKTMFIPKACPGFFSLGADSIFRNGVEIFPSGA